MWHSNFGIKQSSRYSVCTGWHPVCTVPVVCSRADGMKRQQTEGVYADTNFSNSMKNPRKSSGNRVDTLAKAIQNVQPLLPDFPFITQAATDLHTPMETRSPEEESFRTFLHQRLPRHKAPQALRERIKIAIKTMPD